MGVDSRGANESIGGDQCDWLRPVGLVITRVLLRVQVYVQHARSVGGTGVPLANRSTPVVANDLPLVLADSRGYSARMSE